MNKEKVRELATELRKCGGNNEQLITEWLEQTPVEPVVVGLSDEQILDLTKYLKNDCTRGQKMDMSRLITDWQKTQTFVQHRAFDDSELSEKYMTLYDDYQSLLIDLSLQKKQQFLPNWDKIPVHADWYFVSESYCENEPTLNCVIYKEQRPQPTPQVEVGQVWKLENVAYEVSAITQINGEKYVVVRVCDDWLFPSYTMSDFLAKFERVA